MKTWLGRLGLRLAMAGGVLPHVSDELLQRAIAVSNEIETEARGTNGEYKRHQVYARLRKEFPNSGKPAIALAIEVARCST